jgi:hypothetical protein
MLVEAENNLEHSLCPDVVLNPIMPCLHSIEAVHNSEVMEPEQPPHLAAPCAAP